ncbi:alpha/beta fold hydrolase [Polyangium sp. 15x6]|uniref:alpha/beta fold hydrolase n=1 Tax=Polyangium sp. 15x6 TaxID=3042687 RepID=UPI00249A6764|nr:alpha/beta fold hydrolase [Polyangium sp. 15x6]MDI3288758.1 alpha/beta fold hydrolase [Polyangium sp. 15x6]
MKSMSWMTWGIAGAAIAMVAGCGSDEGAANETGGGESGAPMAIAWSPCPIVTDGAGKEAECAMVDVPLDWEHPGGAQMQVFVKRIPGTGTERRQVWLLTGGPGGSGAGLEEALAVPLQALSPSSDIYLVDHRGVGRSARLGCPDQEVPGMDGIDPNEWAACLAHLDTTLGPDLGHFNTTNAARDVGALIERTRAPGQEAHVYGVSYGTYWAQRYLQLFPDQPTSVTLDGLCQAGLCSLTTFDRWVDHVGRKFMGACGADAFCGGKLGAEPLAAMGAFLDGLDEKKCQGITDLGVTRGLAKQLFAALVATLETRPLVPALVYRGHRCAPSDVAAFEHLIGFLTAPPASSAANPDAYLYSQVLSFNVAISEMMELDPLPLAEAQSIQDQAFFWTGDVATEYALFDAWPRYARDAYVGKYAPTTVPMLLMNGTLDPQTPLEFAEEIAPNYTQPHQTFVTFPDAPHALVMRTPTVEPPHTPCALSMFARFVADPEAPVDTACVADLVPLDFHGDPAMAGALLGAADLWEDGGKAQAPEPGARADRALDEVRRAFQRARQGHPFPR